MWQLVEERLLGKAKVVQTCGMLMHFCHSGRDVTQRYSLQAQDTRILQCPYQDADGGGVRGNAHAPVPRGLRQFVTPRSSSRGRDFSKRRSSRGVTSAKDAASLDLTPDQSPSQGVRGLVPGLMQLCILGTKSPPQAPPPPSGVGLGFSR